MNKTKTGYILFDEFAELIRSWSFVAPDEQIREVFNWLDHNKDHKISFEDLRATAG